MCCRSLHFIFNYYCDKSIVTPVLLSLFLLLPQNFLIGIEFRVFKDYFVTFIYKSGVHERHEKRNFTYDGSVQVRDANNNAACGTNAPLMHSISTFSWRTQQSAKRKTARHFGVSRVNELACFSL